jgi:RNA polymerase sigma factor (sigma-70 family)
MVEASLEQLVTQASNGDKFALEKMVRQIQDKVYGLALRMLWHPADAEDATQEILIKVITHLSSFRGDSAFMTWVYRVASNYLLTTRKRRAEREEATFADFSEQLDAGLLTTAVSIPPQVDQNLLVEEAKIGCMQGMLQCLDRNQRLVYILGEIMGLNGREGADVLQITPAAFRKRLSRARQRIAAFMQQKCGLANPANRCRCQLQVEPNVANGRIQPTNLLFATHPARISQKTQLLEQIQQIDELERAATLFRTHPDYTAPTAFITSIQSLLDSSQFK